MSKAPSRGSRLSTRAVARLVAAGVALVLFVVFVLQNGRTVQVRFLFWDADMRLAWALLIAGLLGVVLGIVLPRLRRLL